MHQEVLLPQTEFSLESLRSDRNLQTDTRQLLFTGQSSFSKSNSREQFQRVNKTEKPYKNEKCLIQWSKTSRFCFIFPQP